MTVTITPIGVGTVEGDDTGDKARVGAQSINANEANLKAAVESLEGRFWTVRNTTLDPLVIGTRYMANNHAGITFTTPATFTLSATAVSDIWITNADDASNITLTPASGDAFFVDGATHGVDTTYAITPGNLVILSPRTTDSEWDLIVAGGAGGWADMSAAVWAGGTQSEVADGASAVAFDFDTDTSYVTAGAKLISLKNNTTEEFGVDKDGVISLAGDIFIGTSQSGFTVYIGRSTDVAQGASKSVFIGDEANANGSALSDFNVGVGSSALRKSVGTGNTGIGYQSGDEVTSGDYNTSLGYSADFSAWNAEYQTAIGANSKTPTNYSYAWAGKNFAVAGDNQFVMWQPAATTTDATPATLFLDESGGSDRMDVASGKCYFFEAHVCGVQSDGTDAAYYTRKGIIANNAGTTALIGAVQTIGTDIESNASCDAAITADDTNDALQINVTGITAETWRWSANVFVKDITIGA